MTSDPERAPDAAEETGAIPPEERSPAPGETTPPSGSAPSRPHTPGFAAGDLLAGRYRVVRFIAHGGMGEVYEVQDLELGERVALKTIRAEIARDETSLSRFKREIQLSRRLAHPNVCRMFDLGHHRRGSDTVVFLTMELLEGETLRARVKRVGRLDLATALPLARQVCSALAAAHEAGVVHRDFKSANVLLVAGRAGERAVVTDFGLARGTTEGGALEESLTGSGDIVGTPAYMAPEQVEGRGVGPAADLYALGVVLFEMVTARWPFAGETPISMVVKRLTEKPPSPRVHVADLDPRWEAVILKCLERKPADRFASAAEVAAALEPDAPLPAPAPEPPAEAAPAPVPLPAAARPRGLLLAVAVAAAVLSAGYAVWRSAPREAPPPSPGAAPPATRPAAAPARRSVAVLGFKNLAGRPEAAWLSTAISEMLRSELGAGGTFRTVPGENVARMKVELALADADSLARDTLGRIGANLAADLVVVGSYAVTGGRLRIDLRIQDTRATTDEVIATAIAQGTEAELFDLVAKAGAELREKLGAAALPQAESARVRASLPANAEAARLYSEGLARLRLFDALAARDLLLKAVAADPAHPLIHSALASAWSALGYDEKARAEARRAHELAKDLSREDRLSVEGLLYETTGKWDDAVRTYQGLFAFFPDNLEYGLRLASAQTAAGEGRAALDTIESLHRQVSASDDPRIDLAQASASKSINRFEEMAAAASRAAEKAQARGARLLYAEALLSAGDAAVNSADLANAQQRCGEAIPIFAEAGDGRGVARCQNVVGVALAKGRDLAGARERFEQALAAFRKVGDQTGVAAQLGNLGTVLTDLGRFGEAESMYRQGLAVAREAGQRATSVQMLNNLGSVLAESGNLEEARAVFERVAQEFADLGQQRNGALALANLGEVLQKQGKLEAARAAYEKSLSISRGLPEAEEDTTFTVGLLGGLLVQMKRFDEAKPLLEEARTGHHRAGDRAAEARVVRDLAAAVAARDPERAGALEREAAALEPARAQ